MKQKQVSRAALLNEIEVLKASTLSNLASAKSNLDKLHGTSFMASGLVIEIKDLSGNRKVKFMIADGLLNATIAELKFEITKTMSKQSVYLNGIGVKNEI